MKDVIATISALYKNTKMFDTKLFEKDVEKHLKIFFKKNFQDDFFGFAKKVDDYILLEATLGVLAAPELRRVLRQIDSAWLKPNLTIAQLRHRALALATGDVRPASDISLRAKARLPSLKSAKTLDALRAFHEETGSNELSRATIKLLSSSQRKSLARRFDKFNPHLLNMSDNDLLDHLFNLASFACNPAPKKIASAAAKAKWSGKEPD